MTKPCAPAPAKGHEPMAFVTLSAPRLTKVVPLIVALARLMENIDQSVLSTSLPAMSVDLNTDPIHLKLVLVSYLLALAVFLTGLALAGLNLAPLWMMALLAGGGLGPITAFVRHALRIDAPLVDLRLLALPT